MSSNLTVILDEPLVEISEAQQLELLPRPDDS